MDQLKEQDPVTKVILTSPLSLDVDSTEPYIAPNIFRRILSLLNKVRPGSDLTHFQLPPLFNLPKSQLQLFGEAAYCVTSSDILESCWKGETPLTRFTSIGEAAYCFLGRNSRTVKGRISQFSSSSSTLLYEITGHWDRTVTMKDVNNGKSTVIYNARDVISRLKDPIVRDLKEISPNESAAVWGEVSESILKKEWEKAGETKREVEEIQRKMRIQRESIGEKWVPKHFSLSYMKDSSWYCSPLLRKVPPAPIEVPV